MNSVSIDSILHTDSARRRREDHCLLTGKDHYAGDLSTPGILVAAVLRSPFAHARIGAIDTTRASELPGVAVVLPADNIGSAQIPLPSFGRCSKSLIERWQPTIRNCSHPTLAHGKVRYVGQHVAMVIAEIREIAEDAVELIDVDYVPIAAVMNVDDALREDGALIFEGHPTSGFLSREILVTFQINRKKN
jgi:aerobic carbon-monoxide dehydrogenase large subunit